MVSMTSATIATIELQFNRWNQTKTTLHFHGSKLTKEVIHHQFQALCQAARKGGKAL